jgi:hypothetical protein
MKKLIITTVCSILTMGCATFGASTMIKSPIENQCARFGLLGCDNLVNGIIAYIKGDVQTGEEFISKGIAENIEKTDQLEKFAQALEMISSAPGMGQYLEKFKPIISMLKNSNKELPAKSNNDTNPIPTNVVRTDPDNKPAILENKTDQLELSISYLWAKDNICPTVNLENENKDIISIFPGDIKSIFPENTICSAYHTNKEKIDRILVSDSCPLDVIITASEPYKQPHWLIWVQPNKGLDMRDANLFIDNKDTITIANVGGKVFDARCGVNIWLSEQIAVSTGK